MKVHLYLSLIPESLVFSMLDPQAFGRYLALGADRRTQGQAIFLEVDPAAVTEIPDLGVLREHCKPHSDGQPHKSSYVTIYRALERVPITALGALHLVTRNGAVLEIKRAAALPEPGPERFHLYQEFVPVNPLVSSRLSPADFGAYITRPNQPVFVPRIIFGELGSGPLADDPDSAVNTLPYRNLAQVRSCFRELKNRPDKKAKIVERKMEHDLPFWMMTGGFFVADQSGAVHYPMPSEEELRGSNFNWWSSARAVEVL